MPALDVSLPIFSVLICIGLVVAILTTRQLTGGLARLLFIYLFVTLMWNVSLAWSPNHRPLIAQWGTVVTSAAMGILFWMLAQFGRERPRNLWRWVIAGGSMALVLSVLAITVWYMRWNVGSLLRTWLWQTLAGVIWVTFAAGGIVWIGCSASIVNRRLFLYWTLAFVATLIGISGVISPWSVYGALAPMWSAVGAVSLTIAVLNSNWIEARSMFRHFFVYIIVTLLAGVTLVASLFIIGQAFAGIASGLGVIIVAGTVGVVYGLFQRVVSNVVDRLLFGSKVDYANQLQTFNRSVRDILDPEQLAETMASIAHKAMGVERGILLIAESSDEFDDITFRVIGDGDSRAFGSTGFRALSPLMDDLRRKGKCVTRSALDADSRYQSLRPTERDWLYSLGVELFVPIRARGQLVGVLALGRKARGVPYRAEDLEFLAELADRSGFPLQNARLFSEMRMLNSLLNHLYTDLDVANRRMQEMDRLKSAFIGVVTHELRSPLVGIDFSLQLLQRQGWDELTQEQKEPIQDILKGFQQLKGMIDKLVNFAAFLSKQGDLRKEEIDFGHTVRKSVEPLEVMAQFRQIKMDIQIPAELPHIWADHERLSEAIYHLVHNAIKFNHPQGQVSISCAADQEVVSFKVVDTGVGVSSDKLKTIWDGFSQSADSLRRGVEGLGLGLALVKYIVGAHGGEVWAYSRLDEGSTFGFRIPIGQPPKLTDDQIPMIVLDRQQSWGQ